MSPRVPRMEATEGGTKKVIGEGIRGIKDSNRHLRPSFLHHNHRQNNLFSCPIKEVP